MKIRFLFSAVAALAAVALVAGCGSSGSSSGSKGGGTIKIGFSGDFSGILAAYDTPVREGAQFAVKQINERKGPYKVELTSVDNESKSPLTVSQTQKLLEEGVQINIIGTGSGRTAAATLVDQKGGLALGTLNTYPTFVDEAGPNSALLVVTDNIQAAASAQYACNQGYRTAYTFASPDFAYSQFLPVYWQKAFEHFCGGKVVGTGQFHLGQTDYSALITNLKSLSPQPDVIYSPMFVPDSVAFAKQLRQAGVHLPYLSSDANYLQEFATAAGSASSGIVASPYAFASPNTALGKFQAEYKAATGKATATPLYEAVGRDQIYAVVAAAEMAHSTDPKSILEEFSKLPRSTFVAMQEATIGPTTHSTEKAKIPLVKIENGNFSVLTEVNPTFVPKPVR